MQKPDPGRELDRDVAGCAAAHQVLLAALDGLSDDDARRPSLLPGWSVGHVLTHLARNADGLAGIFEGAERGEEVPQYPSLEARNHDIEAGSSRPARDLVGDVRRTIWRLESTWASTTAVGWEGFGLTVSGRIATRELPRRRWTETVVHHADLGLGYQPSDWPDEWVRLELRRLTMLWTSRRPMGMTELPPEARALDDRTRLRWLLGRAEVPGLPAAGIL
ncbi:MAG: maleylpyruvate isomerase family mycothiol-dependent enzyme [Actinobacteria bacterium]|nr:maleylpyruvate isomerase family mycothiol-dependent enzyme [Actinomycetota bacterium]